LQGKHLDYDEDVKHARLLGGGRSYSVTVRTFATGKLSQAAAKYGENAPMAATCCNACRTCVQTNLIALGVAAAVGAGAWVTSVFRRFGPA